MLDQAFVHDAAIGWVHQVATGILDEESLRDTFVDDHQGYLGLLANLVVDLGKCLAELSNLSVDDLVSHSITHSITEDNEVCRQIPLVVLTEDVDSFLERLFHLHLNDLLALSLNYVLTVVLAQLWVSACCKADDRAWTGVANIDSNQHGSHLVHGFGESQMEQVA